MKSKILFFITSIVAIIVATAIFLLTPVARGRSSSAIIVPPTSSQNSQDIVENNINENKVIVPIVITESASIGLPVRLKIPKIGIDATVEYVGLKTNGEMDTPKDPAGVAWLQIGARPGNIGSAVIAGHYGILENGEDSIFDNLKKLNNGDQIYVEDDKGAAITFIVRESRSYEADADASGVFGSSDGKAHLNLVTCQNWDQVAERYTKRLVIFTDKETKE